MSLSVPTSEAAMCSLALSRLKQVGVSQIDPARDSVSTLCAQWYEQKRQARLRTHPWNFASTRIQLTPDLTATPAFGFSHAYLLPSDWIRYIGRYDESGVWIPTSEIDYEIESKNGQKYYLTEGEDGVAINIRYVTDFQNIVRMDPLFRELLILDLAIVFAPNFSGSESRVTTLLDERKDMETKATAIDGQERPPRRYERSRFAAARRRGARGPAGSYTTFSG